MADYRGSDGRRNFNGKNAYPKTGEYEGGRLPDGYLKDGYYLFKGKEGEERKKDVLRKEYIVEYPKKIASALSDSRDFKSRNQNKRSQIRKFYEYTLRIQEFLRRKNGDFELVEAELERLLPFVNYARSRETVSDLFVSFIEKNVLAVHDVKDLAAFVKHFEAIIAYLPKDNN